MVVPVDVLSYALGLFSNISKTRYFLATLIGVTPFAFLFAFVGSVNIFYQLGAFGLAMVIFLIGILIAYYKHKKENQKLIKED